VLHDNNLTPFLLYCGFLLIIFAKVRESISIFFSIVRYLNAVWGAVRNDIKDAIDINIFSSANVIEIVLFSTSESNVARSVLGSISE